MSINDIAEKKFAKQIVLVRADFNVPVQDGTVLDVARIAQVKPTVERLLHDGATVVLLSHFGRPSPGNTAEYSLQQVLPAVQDTLGCKVKFLPSIAAAAEQTSIKSHADVYLLENVRFFAGEQANNPELAQELADLGDAFVNDAFSVCHRAHASVVGVAERLPAYAGLALKKDLDNLHKLFSMAEHPMLAIVGGAKVSTKLEVLEGLIHKADTLMLAGGMANTFLKAQGYPVGKSLYEPAYLKTAEKIMKQAEAAACDILLPSDAMVTEALSSGSSQHVPVNRVGERDIIVDVGPQTLTELERLLDNSRTVVWNGPLGIYETPPFNHGTQYLAKAIASRTKVGKLQSLVGGGDSLAALQDCQVLDDISYACTAGGAFLEWLAGRNLPGLRVLGR